MSLTCFVHAQRPRRAAEKISLDSTEIFQRMRSYSAEFGSSKCMRASFGYLQGLPSSGLSSSSLPALGGRGLTRVMQGTRPMYRLCTLGRLLPFPPTWATTTPPPFLSPRCESDSPKMCSGAYFSTAWQHRRVYRRANRLDVGMRSDGDPYPGACSTDSLINTSIAHLDD
jgi:hypothetical protein